MLVLFSFSTDLEECVFSLELNPRCSGVVIWCCEFLIIDLDNYGRTYLHRRGQIYGLLACADTDAVCVVIGLVNYAETISSDNPSPVLGDRHINLLTTSFIGR